MELSEYLRLVNQALEQGNHTEHTHRPTLKGFLESLKPKITATNEPRRVECGAPDYVVSLQTGHGPLTIGHVETKDVGASLAEIERSERAVANRREGCRSGT